MKTLSFTKTSSFLKRIKVFLELAVGMTTQLSENMRFMGVCVETKSARTIRAQTTPLGWLIP